MLLLSLGRFCSLPGFHLFQNINMLLLSLKLDDLIYYKDTFQNINMLLLSPQAGLEFDGAPTFQNINMLLLS